MQVYSTYRFGSLPFFRGPLLRPQAEIRLMLEEEKAKKGEEAEKVRGGERRRAGLTVLVINDVGNHPRCHFRR